MEEKKSNVFSLRKKSKKAPSSRRAQISNPILKEDSKSAQLDDTTPAPDKSQLRPPTGGKTADYVKRRYSTRPGGFPGFDLSDAPQVPNLPILPPDLASIVPDRPSTAGHDGSRGPRQDLIVDPNVLRDPHLRADQYVAKILVAASESEIREYQNNLRKMRSRTSTDLQQNVYQNRTRFIEISREAEKLKGEMRSLRSLMSELKTNTTSLNQASASRTNGASDAQAQAYAQMTSKARKLDHRSSVANLEAMHNAHLQRLWKEVEGSQRFLPATPGRQVLRESRDWIELNAATWKLGRHVDMCLLNDHLLVAARKKKRIDPSQASNGGNQTDHSSTTRLVAERCWPLTEIHVVDLLSDLGPNGSTGTERERLIIANAIKIRVGNDSFTYSKADSREKAGLLADYRKAADDLRKQNRLHRENRSDVESALKHLSRGDLLGDVTESKKTLSTHLSKQRPDIMFDVEGKQQNLRWVEGEMDELDINIAVQAFANAVPSVEKMRKIAKGLRTNALVQNFIHVKTDERADLLADLITRRLVDRHSYLEATKQHVDWLVRLNFGDRAREAYLEARSKTLAQRTRQCIFEGDLPHYIFQLSFIYFSIIRNTVTIYQACFPPLLMSACVRWAKAHVDGFNELLGRQLGSFDRHSKIWRECVQTAKQQAVLMSEVGLDFKGMVASFEEEELDDPDIF